MLYLLGDLIREGLMARKRENPEMQKAALVKSLLTDSNLYRNIASRLASGRWYDIDP